MLCLNLPSTDPFFNLAADEYLLKNSNEEFLVLGVNSSSVIIGKHQSPHIEADTEFITKNNIPVIRRISGGGTVFHDQGNLNFSFILNSTPAHQVDFKKYTEPVIRFLATVGVEAVFGGKNDLKVNGLKISGNAEHVYRERVLHHGTLLFDSQLDIMRRSLRKNSSCYYSRAVRSNPSPVNNLKDCGCSAGSIDDLQTKMFSFFLHQDKNNSEAGLSCEEISGINELADSKYRTWEWNYAYGPEYQFIRQFEINGRVHKCNMLVKDGIIKECKLTGSDKMADFAKKLIGCRHMVSEMKKILRDDNIPVAESDIYKFF